ncbi:guanine nucleotide-binding protein, beta subunit [Kipferlia bialata]|uniref:Guanine nucleotide-binding protein, beta subunit n=1 Tax=Kipferlia bialata TaxID=797122 RepID=A0A9K3CVM2_9EUKA|nr:guanine nucleotide-binding protein, beta subunit [Kipferlia bialata]|eukprot:g4794.t1
MSTVAHKLAQARHQGEILKEKIKKNRALKNDTTLQSAAAQVEPIERLPIKARRTLEGHVAKLYSLCWATDSRSLVSASQDGKLIVWDAPNESKTAIMPLRSNWVMACAFSPNRRYVACGGLDNTVSIYDQHSNEVQISAPCRELHGHRGYISSLCFVDNKRYTHSLSLTP